jgi:hypothetical protein
MEITLNYGHTVQVKRIERISHRWQTNFETLEWQASITRHRVYMKRNTHALANRCRYSISIWVIDFEDRQYSLAEYFSTEKEARERVAELQNMNYYGH